MQPIDVNNTGDIWNKVWENQESENLTMLFSHTLFVDGYKVYKKYLKGNIKTILEAGGGSGKYGIRIASEHPDKNITIIDIAPASLYVSKKLSEEAGVRNTTFIQNNVLDLSFDDRSFDCVF